jgi:hypothetical protein
MFECENWLFLFAPFCYIFKYLVYIFGAIIVFSLIFYVFLGKCPKCKSRSVSNYSKVDSSWNELEQVKKENVYKDNKDNIIFKVERSQQELVPHKKILKWCKCKSCGYVFNQKEEII